jgi:tRNA pseudouridine38-40 synthase
MRNIKLTIEYDGTDYHGWQSQANAISVQGVLEKALKTLTGEDCPLTGASRTDAGVHAYGQTANFFTDSNILPSKYFLALNTVIPDDISIVNSEEVGPDFHSRFCAKGKKYKYLIYNKRYPSALMRNRSYHVPLSLNIDYMKEAAECFLGKHDFSAFQATGSAAKTSVRTITGITIENNNNLIELNITGDGFLYNMVRIITGTLIDVGLGRTPVNSVARIIENGDRRAAGRTAPPQGLYLVEVFY